MDNFKIIYKILKILERAMDYEEFDTSEIQPNVLGVNAQRWAGIMEMLMKESYVDGISVKRSVDNRIMVSFCNPRITLKGLEYLNENSFMKRAANLAKGIKDTLPGI